MILKFHKDDEGWAIVLLNSPFSRSALAMVAGADTFLDILAEGTSDVSLAVEEEPVEGYNKLEKITTYLGGLGGADYVLKDYNGIEVNYKMWLCSVCMYVFRGLHPKTIYFSKLVD